MKKYLIILLCVIGSSAFAQKTSLKPFAFLAGSWEMKTKKGKIVETWVKSKDSLNGKSYRHNLSGDSVLTEAVVIKHVNGLLSYCVTGFEQNNLGTTKFKLIASANNTYVFENKTHDFPQRIVYQKKGKDQILAWIEGKLNGKKMKSEFPYNRRK
ncbi:MAG: hypothetical protein EOO96_00630 [Pedobacter sp.]|nr:MAG: hypothetical protein EOO96_00630 [Pedobacter sp.]